MARVQDDPSADDLLIEKLRTRAYGPAWRFDKALVPADWMAHRYGNEYADLARKRSFGSDSNGMIYFPAGSAEAIEYYRNLHASLCSRRLLRPRWRMLNGR